MVVDVHFSEGANVPNASIVCGERDSFGKEAAGAGQAESPSDDGAKTIGPDDVSARQRPRASVRTNYSHSTHPTGVIPDKIDHPDLLLDAGAGRSRPVQDYRVENDSPYGKPVVAKSAKSMSRRKLAVSVIPVWRAHPHAGKPGVTRALDLIQDVHVGENA
jgi:hypothetical protein